MSDKLQPNPEVPSLWGAPVEGGRNFRAKKDVKGMANRVGKQWENVPTKKDLVPLPESPTSKAKPKVMANLPGVNYKGLPPTLVSSGEGGGTAAVASDHLSKPGKLRVGKAAGDSVQKPGLFAGGDDYYGKALEGKQND